MPRHPAVRQAFPLGISSWPLAYPPPSCISVPAPVTSLNSFPQPGEGRTDICSPFTFQGWTSPPSSASWTQLSEGSPFSPAPVNGLGSDRKSPVQCLSLRPLFPFLLPDCDKEAELGLSCHQGGSELGQIPALSCTTRRGSFPLATSVSPLEPSLRACLK